MRVVIVGAGGHGTVVGDILFRMRATGSPIEPVAYVDDHPATDASILSLPVIPGGVSALSAVQHDAAIVAIGDNATRRLLVEHLRRAGVRLVTASHPSSVVAADACIGEGTMICAGAVVNPGVRIGTGVILNTHCSVDHHGSIGDYVHVGPGAHLGGYVSVGDGTLIGIGATVTPQRCIGRNVIVGAGAVVIRNLPDDVVAVGVPARTRRIRVAEDTAQPPTSRPRAPAARRGLGA